MGVSTVDAGVIQNLKNADKKDYALTMYCLVRGSNYYNKQLGYNSHFYNFLLAAANIKATATNDQKLKTKVFKAVVSSHVFPNVYKSEVIQKMLPRGVIKPLNKGTSKIQSATDFYVSYQAIGAALGFLF